MHIFRSTHYNNGNLRVFPPSINFCCWLSFDWSQMVCLSYSQFLCSLCFGRWLKCEFEIDHFPIIRFEKALGHLIGPMTRHWFRILTKIKIVWSFSFSEKMSETENYREYLKFLKRVRSQTFDANNNPAKFVYSPKTSASVPPTPKALAKILQLMTDFFINI